MRPARFPPRPRIGSVGPALVAAALLAGGCAPTPEADTPSPDAAQHVERTVRQDGVEVRLHVTPARVALGEPVALRITALSAPDMEVTIPPLNDRLQGFILDGQFQGESVVRDGRLQRTWRAQARPAVAEEYRIAPIPVTYDTGWLATPPIVLESVVGERTDVEPGAPRGPVWIYPAFRTVAWTLVAVLAGAAALYGLWRLSGRVRREVALRRLSPRERALRELDSLLGQHLPEQGRTKEFYFELTMIVRRYIERAHHVRAPEQTTEEFLAAVAADARFRPEVVERLRAFLSAADLVKYAAHRPDADAVAAATRTAQTYIEHDAGDAGNTEPGEAAS